MTARSEVHAVEEPMAVVRVFLGLCTSAFLADMQWERPWLVLPVWRAVPVCCFSGSVGVE